MGPPAPTRLPLRPPAPWPQNLKDAGCLQPPRPERPLPACPEAPTSAPFRFPIRPPDAGPGAATSLAIPTPQPRPSVRSPGAWRADPSRRRRRAARRPRGLAACRRVETSRHLRARPRRPAPRFTRAPDPVMGFARLPAAAGSKATVAPVDSNRTDAEGRSRADGHAFGDLGSAGIAALALEDARAGPGLGAPGPAGERASITVVKLPLSGTTFPSAPSLPVIGQVCARGRSRAGGGDGRAGQRRRPRREARPTAGEMASRLSRPTGRSRNGFATVTVNGPAVAATPLSAKLPSREQSPKSGLRPPSCCEGGCLSSGSRC